jgi:hypothetical protein
LLGDVFARIEDMMRLSDSDSFAFEEAEHDVERFRKLLHERTFSLVVLSAFFSQTGMMLGSIPLWRGGTWPFGVQLLTLAFLASLMLLFLLWRFRVMSSTIGGQLLVFLFVLFVASLAMVSGEGSKQYVLQYTSVPFLVTVVMVVTKSAYWALFQNLLWVLLVVAFKFEWLPVVSKPWYCVECLKQATEYINLCVGCAMIVCFLAISVDEVGWLILCVC